MKRIKKNHIKLLCDISEITDLFTDVTSLETFLQKIVEFVSDHMGSEVCSIYLYEENSQDLILRATKGLMTISSIGKVRLKSGEGLTGQALKEMRPIVEKQASKNIHYRFFPGIGEEKYESFLAVPILRGHHKIGVMVVQNKQQDYFAEDDVGLLTAITSQLANTIETAKLLMYLNAKERTDYPQDKKVEKIKMVKGKIGSPGFAYGPALILDHKRSRQQLTRKKYHRAYSKRRFF